LIRRIDFAAAAAMSARQITPSALIISFADYFHAAPIAISFSIISFH